jgi:hypothetical protein
VATTPEQIKLTEVDRSAAGGRMALGAGWPRGNDESALFKRWAATLFTAFVQERVEGITLTMICR